MARTQKQLSNGPSVIENTNSVRCLLLEFFVEKTKWLMIQFHVIKFEWRHILHLQAPQKHQKDVSRVLGLPMSKVVCKTKRLGGGFGGKETRATFVGAAAAIPAYLLNQPVKLTLDRDIDMMTTGQRHSFLGKYKVLSFNPKQIMLMHGIIRCLLVYSTLVNVFKCFNWKINANVTMKGGSRGKHLTLLNLEMVVYFQFHRLRYWISKFHLVFRCNINLIRLLTETVTLILYLGMIFTLVRQNEYYC